MGYYIFFSVHLYRLPWRCFNFTGHYLTLLIDACRQINVEVAPEVLNLRSIVVTPAAETAIGADVLSKIFEATACDLKKLMVHSAWVVDKKVITPFIKTGAPGDAAAVAPSAWVRIKTFVAPTESVATPFVAVVVLITLSDAENSYSDPATTSPAAKL